MQVLIERSKGKKDRYVNLPESIMLQLPTYFQQYKPQKNTFSKAIMEINTALDAPWKFLKTL